ncbi:MAG: gamma-glutamylcyclotransferase family protein [Planctomycetaceae bacterium]
MLTTNVFVYGTLLFPEVTSTLGIYSIDPASGKEIQLVQQKALLNGYRRFTVRLREIGNFPAIVKAEDSVEGSVLLRFSEGSLRRLDEFEGIEDGYYSRDEVRVQVDDETIPAFAYACGEPLRPHLDGPWDAEAFRVSELAWYLQNVGR